MEVYIDDMVVKSKKKQDHINNLCETFCILRKYHMKLKPSKCAVGVSSGQFLGHIVSRRGIEVNPVQVRKVMDFGKPKTMKDVESLMGKIVAMGRFVSKISDRCNSFLKSIKKTKEIEWGAEQDETLENIKNYLRTPPILYALEPGDELYMYLAHFDMAVIGVLFREQDGKKLPIFYVSRMMTDAEKRYGTMKKLVLSLVCANRKLRQYFEGHPIIVLTNQPLKVVLSKPDLIGRMTKWAIELGMYDVSIKPKTTKKGQVLANFILECTTHARKSTDKNEFSEGMKKKSYGKYRSMELVIISVKE